MQNFLKNQYKKSVRASKTMLQTLNDLNIFYNYKIHLSVYITIIKCYAEITMETIKHLKTGLKDHIFSPTKMLIEIAENI